MFTHRCLLEGPGPTVSESVVFFFVVVLWCISSCHDIVGYDIVIMMKSQKLTGCGVFLHLLSVIGGLGSSPVQQFINSAIQKFSSWCCTDMELNGLA